MIVVDNTIIGEAEEIDALCNAASSFSESSVSLDAAVNALRMAVVEANSSMPEQQETKTLPTLYHCRICGSKYLYKSEAHSCEREHKRSHWR